MTCPTDVIIITDSDDHLEAWRVSRQLEDPGQFEDLEHLEDVLEAALVLLLLHERGLLRAEEIGRDLARAAHAYTFHRAKDQIL